MNALTRTATASLPRAAAAMGARQQSSAANAVLGAYKPPTFSKNWLQDSGTYPILVIMSFASFGWVGFLGYKMAYCPTVRITSKTRGQIIRTWK
mmetsp:Transcript_11423/g.23427  ORF Transcript_11423/g.23427 Transcript_11423/m.23427 type:complete len:94 (-) Transcript_11423:1846-2127(-)